MQEELVLDLFSKGFSIDYIIDFIFKYSNKNFQDYTIKNGRLVLNTSNYVSKSIIKGFVYNVLYNKILEKNRPI